MGRTMVYHQRASTSSVASELLERWQPSDRVKYAILHVGVNDVRDGLSASDISENIKSCLNQMHVKFPNAYIGFSEILYTGRGDRDSTENKCIYKVNRCIKQFVEEEDYIMISHPRLQSTHCRLFDDDVHISKDGGTAVLVSDIYKASGWRSHRGRLETEPDADGSRRTFYNSNQQRPGVQRQNARPQNRRNPAPVRRGKQAPDMDQMLQLLTLSVLRNYQGNA